MSTPSSPVCKTPAASKRHSLNITCGPRALHLVQGSFSCSPSPTTSPTTPTIFSPASDASSVSSSARSINGHRPHSARRQSSISYKLQGHERDPAPRSPLVSKHAFSRTSSPPHSAGSAVVDKGTVLSANGMNTPEQVPLTLAEKHGDLLQFIAQKESKCLELRTQLAQHEAELLQLKRKWEQIVSRRFGSMDDTTTSSNVMLEGIREGVQGVGRFIVAGLGDFSSYPPQPPAPSKVRHSAQSSNSSASTSTTQSTRLSESSASSLGEEGYPQEAECHELIVHDTGATPTVSPNPAFVHQQQQQQKAREKHGRMAESFAMSETIRSMYPKKSHEVPGSSLQVPPESVARPPATDAGNPKQTSTMKRASGHSSDLPPVPSIPGLGSLAAVGANVTVPHMSSWVENVGKKWGELQRGTTLSKSQKRASVLLSDVSQSLVSAFSPPVNAPADTAFRENGTPTKLSSSPSLMDDTEISHGRGTIMAPDCSKETASSNASDDSPSPSQQTDDEEWNW